MTTWLEEEGATQMRYARGAMPSLTMNPSPGESSALVRARARRAATGGDLRAQLGRFSRRLGGVAIVIGIWELVAVIGHVGSDFLPTVPSVATALVHSRGSLLSGLGGTLAIWGIGLAIATVAGVVLGMAVGALAPLAALTDWCVRGLRVLPSLALIPVAILVLGVTYRMQVALVAAAAFWPIFVNAEYAVRQIDRAYLESARALNLSPLRLCRSVVLPASLPLISSSVRTAIGLAMAIVISVELVVGEGGLGGLVLTAQQNLNTPLMYAGIVVGGTAGWLLNLAYDACERRYLHWNFRSAGARG
jgi:ABC-type nitrate/sulfonate/bicarbonate transport system permease component